MEGTLTLRGRVGTDLTTVNTKSGTLGIRFRLAVTQWRRTDQGGYEDLGARWYSVRAWGKLARYTLASIRKGDPVVVVGRPQAQAWTNHAGEILSDLLISAQIIGHDLNFGTTSFYKNGGQIPPLVDTSTQAEASEAHTPDTSEALASTQGGDDSAHSGAGLSQVRMETQATPLGSEFRTDGSTGAPHTVAGAFSVQYGTDTVAGSAPPAETGEQNNPGDQQNPDDQHSAGKQQTPGRPKRTPKPTDASERTEAPLALSA